MKIDNSLLNLALGISQTTSTGQAKATASGARSGGDTVRISDLAARVSTDPAKLAQLQASYESGSYRVPAAQVASSLIEGAMRN